jgi:hypothetical protein
MRECLTIVPRKKYMSEKELQEKVEAGLIPVKFQGENLENFYGFLLSRELDIANTKTGEIFDLDHRGEVIHAQFSGNGAHITGAKEYHFEVVDKGEFTEQKIPLVTAGVSIGEEKGGVIYLAKNQIILRGRYHQLPKCLYLDVTNVDVNQKVYVSDLNLPEGVGCRPGAAKELVLECKYKFRDSTLLDALKKGLYQQAL